MYESYVQLTCYNRVCPLAGVGRVDVGSVEENIITRRWEGVGLGHPHSLGLREVVIVSNREDTEIDIIVGC